MFQLLLLFVVVYPTLTDLLQIQPWSHDRRNQTKSNPGHVVRRKRAGKVDIKNGQESNQQRTSSPGRETKETKNKNK